MRAPTADEVRTVLHEASSLDVRARGRLVALRVSRPPGVSPEGWRRALEEGLAGTPLRGVELLVQELAGEPRVLGGVFG